MAKPDYYDATDCDTHDKGAPKFCKKSEPGEGAERSCAYDGARVCADRERVGGHVADERPVRCPLG